MQTVGRVWMALEKFNAFGTFPMPAARDEGSPFRCPCPCPRHVHAGRRRCDVPARSRGQTPARRACDTRRFETGCERSPSQRVPMFRLRRIRPAGPERPASLPWRMQPGVPPAAAWYQGGELNSRPRAYESPALPLSYPGILQGVNVAEHPSSFKWRKLSNPARNSRRLFLFAPARQPRWRDRAGV